MPDIHGTREELIAMIVDADAIIEQQRAEIDRLRAEVGALKHDLERHMIALNNEIQSTK